MPALPETSLDPVSTEALVSPLVIYVEGVNQDDVISPEEAAATMHELGVSDQATNNTAIYMDPKNRLLNYGTHYTNRLGRLRFRSVPELQDVRGDIIRLSTRVRGRARTPAEVRLTFVHEAEHVAQYDRHDPNVQEGYMTILGLIVQGAIAGSRLGNKKSSRLAGTVVGAVLGYELGYLLAPHEQQARQRAYQVQSRAVLRDS